MSHREAKLDYAALMATAQRAQQQVDQWPEWKRQVAAASFVSRPASLSAEMAVGSREPGNYGDRKS